MTPAGFVTRQSVSGGPERFPLRRRSVQWLMRIAADRCLVAWTLPWPVDPWAFTPRQKTS
jgi:hypothetical protein